MKALIVWGGWDGHTPQQTAEVFRKGLAERGFDVRVEASLDAFKDVEALKALDLVVPIWTMGQLDKDQWKGLNEAVKSGVGLGGVHGGMGDAFRGNVTYQWMCGGQFVGHPHVGDYTVQLTAVKHPITRGMKPRFKYHSEQYYMIVDPANKVLAETIYRWEGQRVRMPVVWVKTWGKARVFYSSLGHVAEEFTRYPDVLAMTLRGLVWAAKGKPQADKGA